jgi:hypothetical protein
MSFVNQISSLKAYNIILFGLPTILSHNVLGISNLTNLQNYGDLDALGVIIPPT